MLNLKGMHINKWVQTELIKLTFILHVFLVLHVIFVIVVVVVL